MMTNIEDELRVAQELLVMVLETIGEPVVIDIAAAKERMVKHRMIDYAIDTENNLCIVKVVDVEG